MDTLSTIVAVMSSICLATLLLFAARTQAASVTITNGTQFLDTSGNVIHAHGGGILKVGSYYYWFGENRTTDGKFYAVSCYRSADLKNWEFRNNVLTQRSHRELAVANIERPKVIHNTSTGKYAMWMHKENGMDYSEARAAVAVGDTVDGNYTYVGSFRPYQDQDVIDHGKPGYMSRDCTLFADTDGNAYFISAANENQDLHVYQLRADYLRVASLVTKLWVGQSREAPGMFKRNGYYFLITSGCTGWTPNQQKYAYSTSIASGWSNLIDLGDGTTYDSQNAYDLVIQGSSTTSYLYMGDRWAGAWGGKVNESEYVWLPLTFSSDISMTMSWTPQVSIDTATGQVSAYD
jgi:beta-xylosidase